MQSYSFFLNPDFSKFVFTPTFVLFKCIIFTLNLNKLLNKEARPS